MRNTRAWKSSTISGKTLWLLILVVIGVGGFAFLYYHYIPKYSRLREFRNDSQQLEQRIADLQAQNERLRLDISQIKSDTFSIEALARTSLGMQKPDETIVILRKSEQSTGATPALNPQ